jgi:hypothetical protein
MRNFVLKLTPLFLILALLLGCTKKDSQTGSVATNNLQSIDMKGEKIALKYQFEKGEKLHYKLTTINNSVQSVISDSTQKSDAAQTISYLIDLEVIDVDKNNVADLSVTFSAVNLNATIDGQKYLYDSKANNTKEDKQKFLKYEAEANFNFHAKVDTKGEVLEVSRIDKLVEKMIGLQGQKQPITPEQKQQAVEQLSQQEIRPITQLLFREFTPKALGKDSVWTKSIPINLGPMQVESIENFKVDDFVKVGDYKGIKISANLSFKVSGDKKGTQNGTTFTFDDPKVSGGGLIIFNFEKGYIVRSETTSNLEVSVQMEGKNQSQKVVRAKRIETNMNKNIVELL